MHLENGICLINSTNVPYNDLVSQGSKVKDESNENIMFLCQVLNNVDFLLKRSNSILDVVVAISLTSVNSFVQRDVVSLF